MRSFTTRSLGLGLIAVLLTAAGAEASIIEHRIKPAASAATLRNAPAEPRELPLLSPDTSAAARAATSGLNRGRSGAVSGREPLADSAAAADPLAPPDPFASFRSSNSRGAGFQSGPVDMPQAYPNSTWGKVFGKIPGVGRYSCSATVVRARNRSVLFTAGHCVSQPGVAFATELSFVPSYTNGNKPFGTWNAKSVFVERQWFRHNNSNYDYAAVVLRKSGDRKVEDVTGSLGFRFNAKRHQRYRAVGYPVNKLNGERQWQCLSNYKGTDPYYRGPGPKPLGIGCDMISGASGGGWSNKRDSLVSVTSFGYENRPNKLYGPAFSKKAEKIRRRAARK